MSPGMNEDHLKVLCRFQNVFSQDGSSYLCPLVVVYRRNASHNITGSFFMTPGMNEYHLKVLCRFQNVFSQDGTSLSFVNEG